MTEIEKMRDNYGKKNRRQAKGEEVGAEYE